MCGGSAPPVAGVACTLTGDYAGWKNEDCEVVGLLALFKKASAH